jgi:alanine dehydrogenase
MLIGVPKEIKNHEYRVGLVPSSIQELVTHGHQVMVQSNAGLGIGINDDDYSNAGATIVESAELIFAEAEMIVKVKEPQLNECKMLHEGQILFTYLHLAADFEQTRLLQASNCVAIAYETVTHVSGQLPLLSPMSEVAGRMSIQAGAHCLEKARGGKGMLLGGVPGVEAAEVVVIGGGVVGTNAIRMAMGMGARVTVLDKSLSRLKELDLQFGSKLNTVYSNNFNIEKYTQRADLLIGAVLIPGRTAPHLVSEEMVRNMSEGSVIVDVAIDQGGCIATSRPTTHDNPTYVKHGVVHYCVTNMPGAVPRTATFALNNATLPYVLEIANKGYQQALLDDMHLRNGLNIFHGKVAHCAVADSVGARYHDAGQLLL